MTGRPGLSRLGVHQLQLHVGRHAAPAVAALGLHLVLNGANGVHSAEQVSRPDVRCVDEVCWLPNHTPVNPPPPFRLRLLRDAAVETQPELTHALSSERNEHQWWLQIPPWKLHAVWPSMRGKSDRSNNSTSLCSVPGSQPVNSNSRIASFLCFWFCTLLLKQQEGVKLLS